MFFYTVRDVLSFLFIVLLAGLIVSGFLVACVVIFVFYICESFNRLLGGKGNM